MLELLLSLLGLGQASLQRIEERKLQAASILARIEAVILESALQLDFQIQRIRIEAANASIPPDIAVASLVKMRGQCDQLRAMLESNRVLLNTKGASANTVASLEQWAGTCSVMPIQIETAIQHIELAIANGVGRQM